MRFTRLSITVAVILLGLFSVGAYVFFWVNQALLNVPKNASTRYGVTFSHTYTTYLGLDPEQTYEALIEELGVRAVRLPVYWSEIQTQPDEYHWDLTDRLVEFSEKNEVKLTMVVGTKVPRWPECYVPDWAEKLDNKDLQQAALKMIETTVERYKDSPAVERWQVENEPFFAFGTCKPLSKSDWQARIDLVRRLDPTHPIQITVSGESEPWKTEAQSADILGISMYRLSWNSIFGYFVYPLSPEFYYLRAKLVEKDVSRVIVSELQAEPWFSQAIASRPLSEWYHVFDEQMFRSNLQFVKEAHLSEVYLWGAEWWYLLKQNGDDRLWNVAKTLFNK